MKTHGELSGVCSVGGGKEKHGNTFKYHIKDEHDEDADGEHVAEWLEQIFPLTGVWLRDNYLCRSKTYTQSTAELRLTLVHCR